MYLDYKVRSAFSTFGLKADDNNVYLSEVKKKNRIFHLQKNGSSHWFPGFFSISMCSFDLMFTGLGPEQFIDSKLYGPFIPLNLCVTPVCSKALLLFLGLEHRFQSSLAVCLQASRLFGVGFKKIPTHLSHYAIA